MQRRLSLVNSQADPPGTVSPERSDERMQRRHITRIFALSPGSPGFVSAPSTRLQEYASPPTPKNVRICRCGRVVRSETQYAAQSAADVVHQGFR